MARRSERRRRPRTSRSGRKVAHLTTVDLSLRHLLLAQLRSVRDGGGEAIGISAPGPNVAALEAEGIRHVPLPSSTRGMDLLADLRAAGQLWRALRQERPDVLHTHNPKPGLYGRIVGRLAGVPVVVNTVHGLYATEHDPPRRRLLVYGLEAVAMRFSHAELVQNPEDLALLERWRIAPRGRARLLGNGVDLERFRPGAVPDEDAAALRRELGVGPDDFLVGIVARLVTEKGFVELFDAVRKVSDRCTLAVVGPHDPEKADALDPAVIEAATDAGVRFLGMRTDVETFYAAIDVFVLPSHREGFPRAAMEAAASGVPVIATDVRGCREVVDDGVNGRLVPLGDASALADAIVELREDPDGRARMGQASAALARRRFDERAVVAIVEETYRAAFAARDRRGARAVKRTIDIAGSGAGLVAFGPVLAAVAAVVRVRLGRPVLFRQVRPGRGGRTFTVLKFRTMTDERGPDGEPLPDEVRLTRLGRFLRRASLDELPQLVNVFRGDMSLVGPRPLLVEYLPLFSAHHARRHDVRPGITGLSQVSGRNGTSWQERLDLDVRYVDEWSLALDLRILARTVAAVLTQRGVSSPGHATMPRLDPTVSR